MQHEVARVQPAFHRDLTNQIGDLRRRHAIDPERCLLNRQTQRTGNLFLEYASSALLVEFHSTPEKDLRIHVADQHEHVGQRRLIATEVIAHRPGPRTR
ncbi:hypothetical protein D9M72_534170 [compost metagenome]